MFSYPDEIKWTRLLGGNDAARELLDKKLAELGLSCLPAGQGIITLDEATAHCERIAKQGEDDDPERR